MDNFHIETAQNVTIKQNVANVSTRIGSFIIDWIFIIVYVIIASIGFAAMDIDYFEEWVFGIIVGLPIFLYSLVFETLMNGQTPGKKFNNIRVVKLDGSKPTFGSYLLRWMLRLIDINIASGSVALLTILLNGKGQRLGDLAAGTTVISEKKKISIKDTIIADVPMDYVPTFPQVTKLSDHDIQTIKNLYYKGRRNKNHQVIMNLFAKVTDLMEVKTELNPYDFFETIMKDYNFYTQQM